MLYVWLKLIRRRETHISHRETDSSPRKRFVAAIRHRETDSSPRKRFVAAKNLYVTVKLIRRRENGSWSPKIRRRDNESSSEKRVAAWYAGLRRKVVLTQTAPHNSSVYTRPFFFASACVISACAYFVRRRPD